MSWGIAKERRHFPKPNFFKTPTGQRFSMTSFNPTIPTSATPEATDSGISSSLRNNTSTGKFRAGTNNVLFPPGILIPASSNKAIDYQDRNWFSGKKIATSYPGILSDYLHKNGIVSDIHVITGSVEIAPGIRLADAIFDIVSSGSTLVSNRLKEVETVVESEAVLIGTDSISSEKRGILDELLFRFDSVQAADDKKYILMNVPQKKLNDVLSVLPGIKSPTVMPLADKEWCSVHTVLDEKCFWEIINRLKTAGAEGILVLDIEKMIL